MSRVQLHNHRTFPCKRCRPQRCAVGGHYDLVRIPPRNLAIEIQILHVRNLHAVCKRRRRKDQSSRGSSLKYAQCRGHMFAACVWNLSKNNRSQSLRIFLGVEPGKCFSRTDTEPANKVGDMHALLPADLNCTSHAVGQPRYESGRLDSLKVEGTFVGGVVLKEAPAIEHCLCSVRHVV